jgi:hypothetical protein
VSSFFDKIERLSGAFGDPEYLHLLLEPVFIYGLGFAALLYLLSVFLKDSRLQIVSLVAIAACSIVILPYLKNRDAAGDRIAKIYQIDEPARAAGFASNTKAWADNRWIYLGLAALAATAVFVGPKRNRLGFFLSVSSAVTASFVVILSTWMHYQEAIVYHPNLKTNRSPVRERVEAASRDAAPAAVESSRKAVADGAQAQVTAEPNPRKIRPLTEGP